MKNINKLLILFAVSVFAVGCGKSFLEEEPTRNLTTKRLTEVSEMNPAIVAGGVAGIYSLTFQYGVGGTSTHHDFGQKSFDIVSDMLCGDMAQFSHSYGRFVSISNLQGLESSGMDTYRIWRYYYKIIKEANGFIETYNDQMPEKEDDRFNYGQVKALRAYAYLYLVNFYQDPYSDAKDKKAVILMLKNDDVPKPLSTVSEIYDVIIGDLETAIEALDGFQRTDKSAINQNVARGLLAYAYLFHEDYAKAEQVANDVIASGEFLLMSKKEVIKSGFNNVNIPGWMWAIDLTTDNTASLPTFWGMIDIYTYSYASVTGWGINKEFWDEMPASDIRKTQFGTVVGYYKYRPKNKFFDAAKEVDGDRTWTNDEVYMRVAEMYLAKAEAQAKQGKDAEAIATLKALVKERDSDPGRIDALTGNDLLDEIYYQWRAEMWGEGKSYWAMKRFKKTVTRGSNSFMFPEVSYTYNDDKLKAKIPDVEINSNPEIQ